jgi:transposase
MGNLYVGIDVSKESSSVQGIDERSNKRFYLEIQMNSKGFSELLKVINSESKDLTEVTVAMESTASYHLNFYCYRTILWSKCSDDNRNKV